MPVTDQRKLFQSLQDTSVYPHATDQFQLIETHISVIVLCGPYAYKLKKALDLGFVDFSTLKKRKFYCEEELRLNGRLAPDLYMAVVTITGTPDKPQLEGAGEAIEYAVKMQRFPQQSLLSNMLEQHLLEDTHISQMICQVADFHQRIPAATARMNYGDPEHVFAPAQENFEQMRELLRDSRQLELLDEMEAWAEHEQKRCHQAFIKRKKTGFIRECHGDMHLGNMAVINERVVIFDGIEFNPDFYWIDVMSEVAFICMDLDYHEMRNLAVRFLNGYLDATGDYKGLRVLRFYLWHRAMVRAKVACIRLSQEQSHQLQLAEAQELAGYLQLACSYTHPHRPTLFITHGMSGSGKSTLSQPLVEPLAAIRIRSDRERQRMFGRGTQEGKAEAFGAGVYSEDLTRQTYEKLAEQAEAVLQFGHSAIIDATFLERQQRELFKQLATGLDVPMCILLFRAGAEVLRQRIRDRQHAGRDISEADLNILEHQLEVYTGVDDDELCYTVTIDTESVSGSEQILALINQSGIGTQPIDINPDQ